MNPATASPGGERPTSTETTASPPTALPAAEIGAAAAAGALPAVAAALPAGSSRRNGKIAHLPKEQQNQINHFLDEGVTYVAICQKMQDQGVNLNVANISNWFSGGYQDELRHRDRKDVLAASQDRLLDLARRDDGPMLSLTGMQIAMTQLATELQDLKPEAMHDSFQSDPRTYLRLISTCARVSKGILVLQKYLDEAARLKAADLPKLDIDRELEEREMELLYQRADRIFNVSPNRRKDRAIKLPEAPIEPGNQTVPPGTSGSNAPASGSPIGSETPPQR